MIQNQYTPQVMPQNYANQMQQMAPSVQPMNPPMLGQTMGGMMGGIMAGAPSPTGGQFTPPVMGPNPTTMDASLLFSRYQQPFQQSFQPMGGQPMGGMKGGAMPRRQPPQRMGEPTPNQMGGMKGGRVNTPPAGGMLPPIPSMYNPYGGGP